MENNLEKHLKLQPTSVPELSFLAALFYLFSSHGIIHAMKQELMFLDLVRNNQVAASLAICAAQILGLPYEPVTA